MKKILIITIAVLLISSMLIAKRNDKKAMHNMKSGQHMENCDQPGPGVMIEALKLSPEQKVKIEALRTEHKKTINSIEAEMKNLRIDIQSAMREDNFKRAKELNKALATKKTMLMDARVDHMEAMMKELNAEQKAIAKEMLPNMRGRGHRQGQGQQGGRGNMKGCADCN